MSQKRRAPEGCGWRRGRDGKLYPYARVTWTEDGKLRVKEKRARTITHARDLRAQMLQELRGHGPQLLDAERMTFSQLAERYSQEKLIDPVYAGDTRIAGQRAWRNQRGFLKSLLEYFGSRRLRTITYEDLLAYRKKRFETPTRRGPQRSVSHLNRELSLLRSIFNYAKRSNLITRSPFDQGSGLISTAAEKKRNRLLTRDEEARLLEVCTGRRAHLYYLIITALETGMRKGELLQLNWLDINFDLGIIEIRSTITKTREPRLIGISGRLRQTLESWRLIQQDSEIVFGGMKDVKRSFATACRLAGITDLHFHDLRHTATTRMVKAGNVPMEVMKITGHSQWVTFARYVNVDQEAARGVAETLDQGETNESLSEPVKNFIN